ncbi:MAG: class I SAM-dependent methyltransferase [Eubacteriales bacterium]|jgi:SAM-dependent methyltransferase
MNRNQIKKLRFLLGGIVSRWQENVDFFKGVEFHFKSGKKLYSGSIERTEEGFSLRFNGEIQPVTPEQAADFLARQAEGYDSLRVLYRERGYTMELAADEKNIKTTKREEETQPEAAEANPLLNRQYIIKPSAAPQLLKAIGIMTEQGKIKNDMIRKYNQIDRFIELIADQFDYDAEEITVLDCCCGKSYLSFVINHYLREVKKKKCRIIGVDIKENVIEESRRIARELGYHNMEFLCEDVSCYQPQGRIDMVISLHACDIATDLALALGIRCGAKSIVCVPCCHKELRDVISSPDLAPALGYGVFQTRFNDLMTDAMRAMKLEEYGYDVDVIEYISPLDSPKNLMIKGRKVQEKNPRKAQEYAQLARYLGGEPSVLRRCIW